ncbi:unnamed protein product [Simian adenovirus 40]
MKRTKTSDESFNPVYPYDTESGPPSVPFLTPPFVSPDGFQESPPGVLSLNLAEPLVTSHGMLALKMGSGLSLDDAGNLTSQDITSTTPPLKKTKTNLSLETSSPLTVSTSGALTVAAAAPLAVAGTSLTMQSEAPLAVQDAKLTLATKGPLTVSEGKLALQTSAPLTAADSSTLTVSSTPPISVSSGSLGLDMEDPMYTHDGKLGIRIGGPLRVVDSLHTLTVVTGNGLTVDNNALQTRVTGALGYDTSGNLQLRAAGGMRIDANGQLILDVAYPFDAQNNLSLRLGQGPLYVNTDHNLDLNCNRGLTTTTTNNTKKLETKISSGLDYDTNGAVIIKLGTGLSFDNTGALTVGNTGDDKLTLWTTPDPSPNCRIHSDKDCKFTLVLTKCGSQILASVAALAVSGNLASITGTVASVTIFLRFDQNGVLMENSSLDKQYWNFRNGNSTNAAPYTNAVGFMPNLAAYPKTQSQTAKNNIVSQVYLNGDKSKPMTLTITLNGTNESSETSQVSHYSMSFTWAWESGQYATETFATNSFTFSYIAEQ